MASWLLPPAKRRAAYAVYATCRIADDIVDTRSADAAGSLGALRRFRRLAFRALTDGSDHPVLRELARASREFDVPERALVELFDALEHDILPPRFATWQDLERYCEGVAGTVGEICCSIFGTADDASSHATAVVHARTLGVAMQLTNILRDVGEDASRGRCYVPADELAEYGLRPEWVVQGMLGGHRRGWEDFVRFQVRRGRSLYRQARAGIRLLKPDAQACALACADGYARILDAIDRTPGEVLSRRLSASRLALLGVAWRSWWTPTWVDAVKR